jgi:hypothetical protein
MPRHPARTRAAVDFARVNEPDPSAPPPPGHAALAFAVGVALAATALAIAEWDRPLTWRERAESHFASRPSARVHASTATITSPSEPLAPFATLALSRERFPAEGPVSLSLQLPEPSADAEPRPVTLLSIQDQRVYTTQGRLDDGRTTATIEVPADFLRPGTYLVQLKTTERTHFPLRRYVVEVR